MGESILIHAGGSRETKEGDALTLKGTCYQLKLVEITM